MIVGGQFELPVLAHTGAFLVRRFVGSRESHPGSGSRRVSIGCEPPSNQRPPSATLKRGRSCRAEFA